MRKPIVVSVIMALTLLAWGFFAPTQSQETANEEKPTFYRLIPGVYVNGWPRFTVTYPKDWVEKQPTVFQVFRASSPVGIQFSGGVYISEAVNPFPLEELADMLLPFYRNTAQDVSIVSDKPTRLRDGMPAWELETKMVINGEPRNYLDVATKKGDLWIIAGVVLPSGKIEDYQRAIPYSLQCEPSKDEPVKVPPDVQEFFNKLEKDFVSHDLAKVMAHYSDRFLNSGVRRGEVERGIRQWIGSLNSIKGTITDFVPAGDRAYFAGFVITNFGTVPSFETSIIRENGEWKFYGNQRDVVP